MSFFFHVSRLRHFYFLPMALLLFSCEINQGGKRDVKSDDSIIISYFFSDQYAIDSDFHQQLFPIFSGAMAAAEPNASLDLWKNPPSGCYFTNSFTSAASSKVGIRRLLDVGELRLKAGDTSVPLNQTNDNYYFSYASLTSGDFTLLSPGVKNGVLEYEQNFKVLETGGNIKVYDVNNAEEEPRALASPAVPADGDRIVFNRFTSSVIGYDAPEGTDLIKLRLRDGSNLSDGDITCFAKMGETLVVPEGSLYTFRTGEQGHMELDFISISSKVNVPRLRESTIISAMRHVQGIFEYQNEDGVDMTENVGILEFR